MRLWRSLIFFHVIIFLISNRAKCHQKSCGAIPYGTIAHVAWQIVVILVGLCIALLIITAVGVIVTFHYYDRPRLLKILKILGGIASMYGWTRGLVERCRRTGTSPDIDPDSQDKQIGQCDSYIYREHRQTDVRF